MNFCTLSDKNYLPKLICLVSSLKQHVENHRIFILALDNNVFEYFLGDNGVTVCNIESVADKMLLEEKQKRTNQEYCWMLASWWTLKCVERYELDNITYIDADAFFFSNPQVVFDEIGNSPVAITPHRFAEKDKARLLKNGIYNVCAVTFNKSGFSCLREWANYSAEYCYYKNENGHFADQACWDWLLPKHNGSVINNIGYNTAPWNGFQYRYRKDGSSVYVSDGIREDKLCLYHFHEFLLDNSGNVKRRTDWQITVEMIKLIYEPYEIAIANSLRLIRDRV